MSYDHLYIKILESITTFVFDVDGVLTDSSVMLLNDELVRVMNTRDGYAIRRAVMEDYRVCIITGGRNEFVKTRLAALGVQDIFLGAFDKLPVYEEYKAMYELSDDEILYMGDDIPDLAPMQQVALPTCPIDASPEIRSIAKYISPVKGGRGCVRDVIEQTLKVQNKWKLDVDITPPASDL